MTTSSVVAIERLAQKYFDCFFQLEKQLVQYDNVLVLEKEVVIKERLKKHIV